MLTYAIFVASEGAHLATQCKHCGKTMVCYHSITSTVYSDAEFERGAAIVQVFVLEISCYVRFILLLCYHGLWAPSHRGQNGVFGSIGG